MNIGPQESEVTWFGKLPGHGDFIRSAAVPELSNKLDRWLSSAMQRCSTVPGWQQRYDRQPARYFAYLNLRQSLGFAGYVKPSRDRSQRRFPFVAARTLTLPRARLLSARSPLVLSRLWQRMRNEVDQLESGTGDICTRNLPRLVTTLELDATAFDAMYSDFLEVTDGRMVDGWLDQARHQMSMRSFAGRACRDGQPLRQQRFALPGDTQQSFLLASFWLDLFLGCDAERLAKLGIFIDASSVAPWLHVLPEASPVESLSELLVHEPDQTQADHDDDDLTESPHWSPDAPLSAIRHEARPGVLS